MDEFYMPGLSHFENSNGWSGSRGRLCYEIEPPADGTVKATVWYGPFCRKFAQVETAREFPLTNEGREEMTAWLLEQAEEMNAHPQKSLQDCRDYYEAHKSEL